jgi:hypothetical protein
LLVLSLRLSAVALVLQRRSDREQREQAVILQAAAARRELATKIMIDAFRVLIDSPMSPDDTFLEKIQNPLSMLQLVMKDEDIEKLREMIKDIKRAVSTKESIKMGPSCMLFALQYARILA